MFSIEGKRGEPRPRPPFPAVKGLFDCPTLLNNVETLRPTSPAIHYEGCRVVLRVRHGEEQGSTVLRPFAGSVNNTGLVEVPRVRRSVGWSTLSGPHQNKKKCQAADNWEDPRAAWHSGLSTYMCPRIYRDRLRSLRAIVGSGGLIVTDEDTCMVDFARFFVDFIQDESCGKCPPCRIGTKRMLEILNRIKQGKGAESDLDTTL